MMTNKMYVRNLPTPLFPICSGISGTNAYLYINGSDAEANPKLPHMVKLDKTGKYYVYLRAYTYSFSSKKRGLLFKNIPDALEYRDSDFFTEVITLCLIKFCSNALKSRNSFISRMHNHIPAGLHDRNFIMQVFKQNYRGTLHELSILKLENLKKGLIPVSILDIIDKFELVNHGRRDRIGTILSGIYKNSLTPDWAKELK